MCACVFEGVCVCVRGGGSVVERESERERGRGTVSERETKTMRERGGE